MLNTDMTCQSDLDPDEELVVHQNSVQEDKLL